MPSETLSSEFCESLRQSRLLSEEQRRELDALPKSVRASPNALREELLRRGYFTAYQLDEIAAGRASQLTLGPYVVLDRLGEGGMGQVFKARHRELNRLTALKVIRPDRYSETARERFKREARAAAALKHPHVVLIYDCGEIDGTAFAAMEFIDGTDLNQLVKENGPLTIGQACEYARQAALGLQHAHEIGLIHRDIKPGNLMVANTKPPVVKILDFGLARLGGEANLDLTGPNQMMGTLAYIAPEQAENAKSADIRSDIFSLGCTLYFLLTGRNPFPGEEGLESLSARLRGVAIPLRQVFAQAPAALEAVLAMMLVREPAARYQTPAEVAAALSPFTQAPDRLEKPAALSGSDTVDYRPAATLSAPAKSKAKGQRSRGRIVVAAALLVPLVCGLGYYFYESQKTKSDPASSANPGTEPDAEPPLHPSQGKPRKAAKDPASIVIGDPRFRHWGPVRCVAVSPNGKLIASAGRVLSGNELDIMNQVHFVTLWDADSGAEIATTHSRKPGNEINCLAFSPDNRYLAVGNNMASLQVWDATAKQPFEKPAFTIDSASTAYQLLFEDERTLWTIPGGSVRRWDLRQAQPIELGEVTKLPVPSFRVSAAPDGKWIAYMNQQDFTIYLRNLNDKEAKDRKVLPMAPLDGDLALSPDGQALAVGGKNLHVFNLSGPDPVEMNPAKPDPFARDSHSALAFNSRGTLLAVGRSDGVIQIWKRFVKVGKWTIEKVSELRGHDNEVTALTFAADDTTLVSGGADHCLRIWKTSPALAPRDELPDRNPNGAISGVAFTADGKYLVTASRSGGKGMPRSRVQVRDATTGAIHKQIEGNWDIDDLKLVVNPPLVVFSGREAEGRLMDRHFAATWRWDGIGAPAPPIYITGLGGATRFGVSEAGKTLAILAVARVATGQGFVELPPFMGAPKSAPFSIKGASHIALSHEGKKIAFACSTMEQGKRENSVRINDVADFEGRGPADVNKLPPEPRVVCHSPTGGVVTALLFTPDTESILVADMTGTVALWSAVANGKKHAERRLPDGKAVVSLAVSSAKTRLFAAGSENGHVLVWSRDDWKQTVFEKKFPGPVHSLAFDADGKRLAAGLGNGTAVILTLPEGAAPPPAQVINEPPAIVEPRGLAIGDPRFRCFGLIRHLAVGPNGKRIAAFNIIKTDAGERGSLDLIDGETGKTLEALPLNDPNEKITSLSFSPDGRFLAAGMAKSPARIWDLSQSEQLDKPMQLIEEASVAHLVEFRDFFLYVMNPASIQRWKHEGDKFIPTSLAVAVGGFMPSLTQLARSGQTLVFVDNHNQMLTLLDITKPKTEPRRLTKIPPEGITALAHSPNNQFLAFAGNSLQMLDVSGAQPKEIALKNDPKDTSVVTALAFRVDGMRFAAGRSDGRVQVRTLRRDLGIDEGVVIGDSKGHDDEVTALAFTPDGQKLVTAGADHRIRLWDVLPELRPRDNFKNDEPSGAISGAAFSKDGKYLVMGSRTSGTALSRGCIQVRDAMTGAVFKTKTDNWNITDLTVADGGTMLYFGGVMTPTHRGRGYPFLSFWRFLDPDGGPTNQGAVLSGGEATRFSSSDRGQLVAILGVADAPNAPSRAQIRDYRDPTQFNIVFPLANPKRVALSPDSKRIAFYCELVLPARNRHVIQIHDVAALKDRKIGNINDPPPVPATTIDDLPTVTAMLYASDSETLVYADATGKIVALKGNTKEERDTPSMKAALCVAMSPDGNHFAAGTDIGHVVVWSKDNWKQTLYQTKFAGPVHSVAFDPDGKRLAVGLGNGTAMIVNLP